MRIIQLQYFQAICKNGSISKASKELHVSQPSITTSMKELEAEIGVNLFQRVNKRLDLTSEGEFFLKRVNQILDDINALMEEMHDLVGKRNHIKLGIPLQVGAYFLPIIMNKFQEVYPEIELELIEGGAINTMKMVLEEQLDMAIAAIDVESDNIHWETLFQTEICFCISAENPIAKRECISLMEACKEPLVLFPYTFYTSKRLQKRCNQQSIVPLVKLFTDQLHTIKNLVRNAGLATFLLREAVKYDEDIVSISLDKPMFATIGMLTKKGKHLYKDSYKLIKFMKDEYSNKAK
ncbi:LysR family transcriptional regulator [Petroclostridium sp. X23]|uniref:LysR family transcriptional regulator n=1 Tax=Petroclostridium sp. X23 TaxID=3045146 RepID=UPI0024ACC7AF|nr:LysR family transcriptional regulator [Petroclostridium sp. X23]WHH60121.1 LysR family transcriptional regulator [Petroclostridium sp. X23]